MKRKWNNLKSIIILILLVAFTGTKNINAFAITASDIDLNVKGSINVNFTGTSDGEVNGELMLIKVANIKENNEGNIEYEYTDEFDKCELSINSNIDDKFTNDLKKYIEDNKIEGYTKKIASDGKITFSDLEIGMYFIMQNDTDGNYRISPFVVTIPEEIDGKIYYDVDATPKTELSEIETIPNETTEIITETTKDIPEETTSEEKIPQTGLLVWPVVLLTLVGSLLIGAGIILKNSHSESEDNYNEE